MNWKKIYLPLLFLLLINTNSFAQQKSISKFSLEDCVAFALKNSPVLQRSVLDKEITESAIKSKLSEWYPQIRYDFNLQHAFQLQVTNINGQLIPLGVRNTSLNQFSINQNIFTPDALLASNSAKAIKKQAEQNIEAGKIELTVAISKAFYNVLLLQEQINVLNENIIRLNRNLNDAFNQFEGGIVDKVDYKRATIAVNNAKAQQKTASESYKAGIVVLKSLMGIADTANMKLQFDRNTMQNNILIDTLLSKNAAFERIEYQQLQTQKQLQKINKDYYKWQFAPTVQAYGSYNMFYLNNDFAQLYQTNFPYSNAGIRLGLPIFQGFRRTHNLKQAKLEADRIEWDISALTLNINAEVSNALAAYKSYLNDYFTLKENAAIANEVFETVELQYKSGVKTYLEVITAQTDLRTAEINLANALYQVLSSKLDVERALGIIKYN